MTPPKVSIIIPVFNRLDLTKQLLEALPDSTKVPYEVIVVDNASSDGTQEYLRSLPDITYIPSDVNLNFSGGCNLGAKSSKGSYLCFLNNDTIPFTGWLEALVDELDKNESTTVVGPKLVFPDNTIQHAGVAFQRETRFPYHPYRGADALHPCVNHRRDLQVVTGACLVIRHDWFFRCGMFNNEYINGGEDIELCLKVKSKHGKVIYQPESVLVHLESQSPGRLDFNEKNIETFFKNHPGHLLSDEDAFYFEDGLHRKGARKDVHYAELVKIENEVSRSQWLTLAMCQQYYANYQTELFHEALADVQRWPLDHSVRDWAALVAHRYGHYYTACLHFIESLQLKSVEARQQAIETISSQVNLAPQFNAFYK